MPGFKKQYIVNEKNEPVGVVLDLPTFEKIEDLLEDCLFGKILAEEAKKKPISLAEAKRRYGRLKKSSTQKQR